jgi:hypothetical protein
MTIPNHQEEITLTAFFTWLSLVSATDAKIMKAGRYWAKCHAPMKLIQRQPGLT